MYAIILHLLDHALGLEPRLAGDGVCTYPMPWGQVEPNVLMTPRQYEQIFISPLAIDEITVSHWIGIASSPGADGSPNASCPLPLKFVTRGPFTNMD